MAPPVTATISPTPILRYVLPNPLSAVEAVLSHVVRNKVEAACARSDLFECRRILMEDWVTYLNRAPG